MAKISWHMKLPVFLGATLVTSVGLILALAGPSAAQLPRHATAAHHTASGTAHKKPHKGAHKKPHKGARKGDNGTVKIHRSTTPVTDRRNQPHVCVFYLDAFGFDPAQSVSWQIKSWPPTGHRAVVLSGTLTLNRHGDGHTGDLTLPNGHYKLFWTFAGQKGRAKHKVFWVKCPSTSPSPTPTPTPSPTSSAS